MDKKLPSLYVNRVEKKLNNNESMFYSAHKKEDNEIKDVGEMKATTSKTNISRKVKEIFASPNFVYKMNVTVTLKNGDIINKDVIGQVGSNLLTIDDDLIDINDIKEIQF